ncbi:transcription initiation protein [Corallococcus exiguus]|nr:transcription initiation protein [Corallococcus exiguus]
MPKYVTIGYGDQAGYDSIAPDIRNAAHAHDEELKRRGALMAIAGRPVQVRNHDAVGVVTEDGPFLSSSLPVAGFAIVEARDLEEAIELVSGSPCAVAHGIVEIWPLEGT